MNSLKEQVPLLQHERKALPCTCSFNPAPESPDNAPLPAAKPYWQIQDGRDRKKKPGRMFLTWGVNSRISFSRAAEKCTHMHIISRRPARIQIQWHLDFAHRTGHRLAFGLRMKHICNIILRRVVDLLQTVLECCGLVGGPRALHTSHFGNYHDKSWSGLTVWRTLQRNACQLENCLPREMFNMLNRLKDSYSIFVKTEFLQMTVEVIYSAAS